MVFLQTEGPKLKIYYEQYFLQNLKRGVCLPPTCPMPRLDYGVYFDMRDFALYCYFKYSALLSTAVLPSIMQIFH